MKDFTVVPIAKPSYDGHTKFPTAYKLALQARQSTKKQSLHNQESYESQTTILLETALGIGWKTEDIIPLIENKRKDGKIVDASGTLRIDERPTMQELVHYIKQDEVKAVMTRGVDRLFRHIDMIEPAVFVDICKKHHCIIITVKEFRHRTRIETYNFHENPEDIKAFLEEAQEAADYITEKIEWMNRCRLNKGIRGEYDGRVIPVGFLLDAKRIHYVIYEPYARVVRWLFRRYRELSANFAALKKEVDQKIREQGYLFPFFPDNMGHLNISLESNGEGYTITIPGLRNILTNVAYLGWWTAYETVNRGTEQEHKVLRAKIEGNHPAIVDTIDFWYAYEQLNQEPVDGEKRTRSRHSKVGTDSCDALLEGIVTSDRGRSVYVYQLADEPGKALYVIEDTKETFGDHTHGSLYVKTLDRLFTTHLLEKLEEGKRLRAIVKGTEFEHDLDYLEDVLVSHFIDVAKAQEVITAGMDETLAKRTEEAESLERTLHYGAKKLDEKDIENFSARLAELRHDIAQITIKRDRAQKTQAELAEFVAAMDDIPAAWKGMGSAKRHRFIKLATESMTLTKPAPNWLQLEVVWLWPDAPHSRCYIWQRTGKGESWTEEEKAILRMLYPQGDRATILQALPARSWSAINNQAHDLGVGREYQLNNSQLHRLVSVEDASFMAQVGIELEDPYQHAWWIIAEQHNEERSAPYFVQ